VQNTLHIFSANPVVMGKQCDMKAHGQYAEAYFQVFVMYVFRKRKRDKIVSTH